MSSIDSLNSNSYYPALTALPPYAQALREKEAILNDAKLKEFLDKITSKAIDVSEFAILDDGSKQYIVKTDSNYIVRVNVVYKRSSTPLLGPKEFDLVFFEPEIPPIYYKGLIFSKK